jgi:hypothetical protein
MAFSLEDAKEKGYHLSGVIETIQGMEKGDELIRENNVMKLAVVKAAIIYGVITVKDIAQHGNKYVDRAIIDVLRWIGSLLARAPLFSFRRASCRDRVLKFISQTHNMLVSVKYFY